MCDKYEIVVPALTSEEQQYDTGVTFAQFRRYLNVLKTTRDKRRVRAAIMRIDAEESTATDAADRTRGGSNSPSVMMTSSLTVAPPKRRRAAGNHSGGGTPLFPSSLSVSPGDSLKYYDDAQGQPLYFIRGTGSRFRETQVIRFWLYVYSIYCCLR